MKLPKLLRRAGRLLWRAARESWKRDRTAARSADAEADAHDGRKGDERALQSQGAHAAGWDEGQGALEGEMTIPRRPIECECTDCDWQGRWVDLDAGVCPACGAEVAEASINAENDDRAS